MTEARELSFSLEISKAAIAKFLMAAIGFAGTILFARVLGPATFGGYYLLFSVVKFTDRPLGGFAVAFKKRFSEPGAEKGRIFGFALLSIPVYMLVLGIAVFLARGYLSSYTGLDDSFLLFVLLMVTTGFFFPLQTLIEGLGKVSIATWIDLVRSLLTTPLQVVLVLAGYGAAGMAGGLSIATLLTIPATVWFLNLRPTMPSFETARHIWSYARYSIPTVTIGKAYKQLDLLLLGLLVGQTAAGNYQVAFVLTMPSLLLTEVLGNGLMARISNAMSDSAIVTDLTNSLSYTGLVAIPVFFGALVLSNDLVVTFYGPEYGDSAILLIGIAGYRMVQSQSETMYQAVAGLDKPRTNLVVGFSTISLNLLLGVPLILEFGAVGVVVATFVSEVSRYLAFRRVLRVEVSSVQFFTRPLGEQFVSAAIMAIVVYVTRGLVPVTSWVDLFGIVCAGAVTYGAVLFVISEHHRTTALAIADSAGLLR